MKENKQALDFEAALTELDKVVTELDGEIKLERALSLFERGMKLSSDCEKFLHTAEQKVEILKKLSNTSMVTEPFEDESA